MNRSAKNIFWGVFGQAVTMIIGLILPRLRIVSFGSEVNGLLSSVQQVYVYFALLEAGVGATSLQALYGPVARDDKDAINGVLSATHSYYRRTGIIYLLAVFAFAAIYPLTLNSTVDPLTIVLVILLNGLGNVLAYFFQGKYKILLQAEGKKYIITNLTTAVTTLSGLAKVVLIFILPNVVLLQAVYSLFSLLQVLYFWLYIRRHYKWVNLKVPKNTEALAQKKSALTHQISQLIFNNTSVLILTYFCGLKVVSVYALYCLVYDMISTLISNVNEGFSFKLGQLFNSDRRRFDKMFAVYERFYISLSFALYTVSFLLIPSFIALYTEGVTDINYVLPVLPLLFTIIKILVSGRATSGFVASYAGHFKLTENRAIIEAVINIVVSIVCVNFWGIYGVLIGTIVALLYRANDMIIYCNNKILKRSNWETYKWWILGIAILVFFTCIFNRLSLTISSYGKFFVWACVLTFVIVVVNLLVTYMLSNKNIKSTLNCLFLRKNKSKKQEVN
jgi:O-antigen/teichoic acid export membrane protein